MLNVLHKSSVFFSSSFEVPLTSPSFQYKFILLKALGNGAPVDNVPNGAEVFGLSVLVLEVVRVLPGVNTH